MEHEIVARLPVTSRRDPFHPLALLLAPLASVPSAGLHLTIWHWNPAQAVGALYMALFLVPLCYFLTFFVGLPYLYLLNRLGIANLAAAAAGGLVLGLALGFVIGVALFPLWDWYARLFYLSLGAVCGLAVAVVYWLVAALFRPRDRR